MVLRGLRIAKKYTSYLLPVKNRSIFVVKGEIQV